MVSSPQATALDDFWRRPLPYQSHSLRNRLLIRLVCSVLHRQVKTLQGLEHLAGLSGPFVLVANHSSRREALLLPALMHLLRQGRPVHFLADWNFRLIPGINLLYRASGAITVTRKSARPRFLNLFKPLFEHPLPPMERARRCLLEGRPVGIFPEGTVNRSARLLAGRSGAARLSLETGVPVLPVGIRFSARDEQGLSDSSSALGIHFGAPLYPPDCAANPAPLPHVRAWHARLMSCLARLSDKALPGQAAG